MNRAERLELIRQKLQDVSTIDWARMAALIDGEGSITSQIDKPENRARARNKKHSVALVIANCDPRLMRWLHRTFGGTVCLYRTNNEKWRAAYKWRANCDLSLEILRSCMPYFLLKHEQAEVALALAATMTTNRRRIPDDVIQERDVLHAKLQELKHEKWPEDLQLVNEAMEKRIQ